MTTPIEERLIAWYKRTVFNQGDNYYAICDRHGDWTVSYTNDYPLQHGNGKSLKLTREQFFEAMTT
jgi:hypothetical protein